MRDPLLARMIARNRALILALLLKPGGGKRGSFLSGILGNRGRAEEKGARSKDNPQTATAEKLLPQNILGIPGRILGNAGKLIQEKETGIYKNEKGNVFVTYTSGDKLVTLNLSEPYVMEGEVSVQHKGYQYFSDIIRAIFGVPRTFPLGRDILCRATLLYEKETGMLRLVVETSTEPGGGPHSPYGNVAVLQHTDVVTRDGKRYEMAPLDPGARIVPPGDISGRRNYHCYTIDVTPEELPLAIHTYNLYSWNQGIDFRGTAGDEEIVYYPLPKE